jgi:hypothetical protein
MQVGATPDFAGAIWQPLPQRLPWTWPPDEPHIAWVRFRDAGGFQSDPLAILPGARRAYLPTVTRP